MSSHLVPGVLCALAFAFVFACGCSRDEGSASSKPTVPPPKFVADPPAVYMKDPVFQKAVKEASAKGKAAASRVMFFTKKLKALEEPKVKELGEAKAKEALAAMPEYRDAQRKLEQAKADREAAQRELHKVIHDRTSARRVPADEKKTISKEEK